MSKPVVKRIRAHWPGGEVTFPANYANVTLGQFINLTKPGKVTPASILYALADKPELLRSIPDPLADVEILSRLTFVQEKLDTDTLPKPKRLHVDGKAYDYPENLSLESYGKKADLDSWLQEVGEEPSTANFANATAVILTIYLDQVLGYDYSYYQDRSMYAEKVLELSCLEALGLSAFFLSKLKNLKSSGIVIYETDQRKTARLEWLKNWCLNLLHTNNIVSPEQ